MLGAGILHHDGAVALAHEIADPEVDGLGVHLGHVDLGALVEVDIEGVRIREVLLFLREKEDLLGTARQLLRVHPHLVGCMIAI
jgi:hypothetical protein